jgi:hypothetical protein
MTPPLPAADRVDVPAGSHRDVNTGVLRNPPERHRISPDANRRDVDERPAATALYRETSSIAIASSSSSRSSAFDQG